MMAEALAGPLARAVAQQSLAAAGGPALSRRDDERLAGVPPPMIPNNTESPTTICAMQASGCTGGRGRCWGLPGLFGMARPARPLRS